MSVIAVRKYKDRIEIASDSQMTSGYEKDLNANKIVQVKDILIASAGSYPTFKLVCFFYEHVYTEKINAIKDVVSFFIAYTKYCNENKIDKRTHNENIFFLISNYKIFQFHSFDVCIVKNYAVFGTGGRNAIAGLDMGLSPKEAVKLAIKHDLYCGGAVKNKVIKISK